MKSKQPTAPRDPPSRRTCANCLWARWPYVWYAQTGECQIKRRTYITRDMAICTMFKANERSAQQRIK